MFQTPRSRLHFYHVDLHYPLIEIIHPLTAIIEDAARVAFKFPLACVKSSRMGIFGRTRHQERVGSDSGIDTALVSIHVDWLIKVSSNFFYYVFPPFCQPGHRKIGQSLPKAPDIEEEDRVVRVEAHLLKQILDDAFLPFSKILPPVSQHTLSGISPVPRL